MDDGVKWRFFTRHFSSCWSVQILLQSMYLLLFLEDYPTSPVASGILTIAIRP